MGAKPSVISEEEVNRLSQDPNIKFIEPEIKDWHQVFSSNVPSGRLDKRDLIKFLKRIFPRGDPADFAGLFMQKFSVSIKDADEQDASSKKREMSFRDFLLVMSITAKGTTEEKMHWTFSMYDHDGDGYVSEDELKRMLVGLVKLVGGKKLPDSGLYARRITEQLASEPDKGFTLEEFMQETRKDRVMMQLMGGIDMKNANDDPFKQWQRLSAAMRASKEKH